VRSALAIVFFVGLSACARTPAPASPRAKVGAPDKPPPRSPEGVVLEMATPMPPPSEVATAEDVVVLAEPIPDDAVRELVFAFFDAIRRRDMDAIGSLVSEQAVTLDGRGAHGNRDALLTMIFATLRAHDYSKIAPADIASADRLERFSLADLEALKKKKPEPMKPLDVLVRIAMPAVRGTTDKLFEDYVLLLVRPEGGKLRVVTKIEESGAER
jgi:hypothetical protein